MPSEAAAIVQRTLSLDRLDTGPVFEALDRAGAVALAVLDPAFRRHALDAARATPYRPARPVVGVGEGRVRQRMGVQGAFEPDSPFLRLTRDFQRLWDRALAGAESPFEGPLAFNDLMLQRYTVGALGISPHRDRTGYRNLICLFVLGGRGRFCLCDDRDGRNAREIAHGPGDVILTCAPGFRGSAARPFHFVEHITETRYVFGLRQDRGPGPG